MLSTAIIYASELDDLLNTYTHNSDLSQKTKLENGGTVTIFTRKDLDVMQARNLKDLLKSNPIVRYKESRFGSPDMLNNGNAANFNSSNIRIYIDNQEITSATFGSGFGGAGNVNLDFVDHIEIYSQAPSYEFSTEPTYLLIKLYSIVAARDRGGRIRTSYGTLGFNEEVFSHSQELREFSYFASLSRFDDKTATYYSHDIPIDRNEERYQLFATLYTKEHKLQLSAAKGDQGLSISGSPRATYSISEAQYEYTQLGYDTSYFNNIFFSTVYQQARFNSHHKEAVGFESPASPELEFSRSERMLTSELKYNLESKSNRLIAGVKYRHKHYKTDELKVNGTVTATAGYDQQDIFSVFAEERYNLAEHSIVNIAGQYAKVLNNDEIDDADLLQYRLSHTYIKNDFVFKSFLYHMESLVEPYLYTDYPTAGSLDPQTIDSVGEEIKYRHQNSELKLHISYAESKNGFMQTATGGFVNNPDKIGCISGFMEYTHTIDIDNKITANISHLFRKTASQRESAAFIRSLNRVGSFDLFNELIYNRNSTTNTNYYDYSAGIKYRYSSDLIISVKGENIFGTAYEDSYFRVDPDTGIEEEPMLISPIEQRVYVTMEYLF